MAYGTIRADVIQGTGVTIDLGTAGSVDFSTNLLPATDTAFNLGSSALRWQYLYVDDVDANGDILPALDNAYDLGSPTKRFANVYTGDLHLANDRGDWTVIEESEYLSLRNNKTGRTFKLVMEPVD
jgi:hypothetical protein